MFPNIYWYVLFCQIIHKIEVFYGATSDLAMKVATTRVTRKTGSWNNGGLVIELMAERNFYIVRETNFYIVISGSSFLDIPIYFLFTLTANLRRFLRLDFSINYFSCKRIAYMMIMQLDEILIVIVIVITKMRFTLLLVEILGCALGCICMWTMRLWVMLRMSRQLIIVVSKCLIMCYHNTNDKYENILIHQAMKACFKHAIKSKDKEI